MARTNAGMLVLTLIVVTAIVGVVALSASEEPTAVAATVIQVEAIDTTSTAAEVIEFAQGVSSRWTTIRVKGVSGDDGALVEFALVADRSSGYYRAQEGELIVGCDAEGAYTVGGASVAAWDVPLPPPMTVQERETLDAHMANARALDPSLTREGEIMVPGSLNNVVNPAYWVRKELGMTALTLDVIGECSVADRAAILLRVTFPEPLAKEDHWDVCVDQQTGIILKLVIVPVAGLKPFQRTVTDVELDPVLDPAEFDRSSLSIL